MALKDYAPLDYESTIERKILQNQADVIRGNLSMSVDGGVTSSQAPKDFSPGDGEGEILRKILQNQANVIRGVLSFTTA